MFIDDGTLAPARLSLGAPFLLLGCMLILLVSVARTAVGNEAMAVLTRL